MPKSKKKDSDYPHDKTGWTDVPLSDINLVKIRSKIDFDLPDPKDFSNG